MSAFSSARLRVVTSRRAVAAGECRSVGCSLPREGAAGFCRPCEAVYRAACELRARLLDRRGARLEAANPELFAALSAPVRARLLAHLAAQAAHRGRRPEIVELAGLEDFLAELRELGLDRRELLT